MESILIQYQIIETWLVGMKDVYENKCLSNLVRPVWYIHSWVIWSLVLLKLIYLGFEECICTTWGRKHMQKIIRKGQTLLLQHHKITLRSAKTKTKMTLKSAKNCSLPVEIIKFGDGRFSTLWINVKITKVSTIVRLNSH